MISSELRYEYMVSGPERESKALSPENQKILKELEESVDFAIAANQRWLKDGQTLYLDFTLKVPETVTQAFVQKYKAAGWNKVRIYEDQSEEGKSW